MTERQVLTIGVRIAAVWVFVFFVTQMPQWFMLFLPLDEQFTNESFTFWNNPWTYTLFFYAMLLLCSAVLWFRPEVVIPKKKLRDESSNAPANESRGFQDLQFTLISTLGLYFLASGLISIFFQFSQTINLILNEKDHGFGFPLHFYLTWASLITKVAIGLLLMICASPIVRFLRRLRQL